MSLVRPTNVPHDPVPCTVLVNGETGAMKFRFTATSGENGIVSTAVDLPSDDVQNRQLRNKLRGTLWAALPKGEKFFHPELTRDAVFIGWKREMF